MHKSPLVLALYALLLCWFSTQVSRAETGFVLGAFGLLFLLYALLLKSEAVWSLKQLLVITILLRLCVWGGMPWLTDDFFRFVWDGRMTLQGIHPLELTPSQYLQAGGNDDGLFAKINSPKYYTVYPLVCQLFFGLSALGKSLFASVIILRASFLLAEIGTVWLLARKYTTKKALWYALNPLVIVELSGNLHFECLAIFFLTLMLCADQVKAFFAEKQSAGSKGINPIAWTLAVATKINPMLLAPILLAYLPIKQAGRFLLISALMLGFLFLPLFYNPAYLMHMRESLNLYFIDFQINASVFYLLHRSIYYTTGENEIMLIGPLLSILTVLGVFYLAWRVYRQRLDLGSALTLAMGLHLILSTTVHPWYILMPFALAFHADDKRLLWITTAWTCLVTLSYTHYIGGIYREHFGFIALEYSGLIAAWIFYTRRTWSL